MGPMGEVEQLDAASLWDASVGQDLEYAREMNKKAHHLEQRKRARLYRIQELRGQVIFFLKFMISASPSLFTST